MPIRDRSDGAPSRGPPAEPRRPRRPPPAAAAPPPRAPGGGAAGDPSSAASASSARRRPAGRSSAAAVRPSVLVIVAGAVAGAWSIVRVVVVRVAVALGVVGLVPFGGAAARLGLTAPQLLHEFVEEITHLARV